MMLRLMVIAILIMVSNHCHAYNQAGFVPTTEKLEETKTEHFHIISRSVKLTGKRFKRLAWDMLCHERQIQQKNIKELTRLAPTKVPRLTDREIIVFQPVFVGNKIYFCAQEEEARDSLYVYDPEQKKTQKIAHARRTADTAPYRQHLRACHDQLHSGAMKKTFKPVTA